MTASIPQERLRSLIHRHETVTAMLSAGPEASEYVRLSRELAGLDPVAEKARSLAEAEGELADTEALIADQSTDTELKALAEDPTVVAITSLRLPNNDETASCQPDDLGVVVGCCELVPDPDEDVLNELGRLVRVPAHAQADGVHAIGGLAVQGLERLHVALLRRLHQGLHRLGPSGIHPVFPPKGNRTHLASWSVLTPSSRIFDPTCTPIVGITAPARRRRTA